MSLSSEKQVIIDRLMLMVDNLDGTKPVVAGSAALPFHGIELGRRPGDIDIFLPTEEWFELRMYTDSEEMVLFVPDREDEKRLADPPYLIDTTDPDFPVHFFFAWRYRPENNWDIADMHRRAVENRGFMFAPLDVVYQQKLQARRPKDLRDMALILEQQPEAFS